jgi:hypothetical protein
MSTKRKIHHKQKMTIPLAVVAGFMPLGIDVAHQLQAGEWEQAGYVLQHNLIGVNPWTGKWDTQGFSHGLYPILGGFGVHWIANKVGINRMLSQMRIPLIRI